MKKKLIIFLLYLFLKLVLNLPSDTIWGKLVNSIERGDIIIPYNKSHFVFDEYNYLKLDLNDTKMQELYKKQEDNYVKNGISNYIFIVNSINENLESLEKVAKNLNKYISRAYPTIDIKKALTVLFSMKTRRIRIQPGENIEKKFSSKKSTEMINNLQSYMRNELYYQALIKLVEDIDYYYNKKTSILAIFGVLLIIGAFFGGTFFCVNKLKSNGSKASTYKGTNQEYKRYDSNDNNSDHGNSMNNSIDSDGGSGNDDSGGGSGGGASGGW